MITESISTDVFISTILFFLIVVLFRKILLGHNLSKHEIVILPLLFFIWYGGTKIMTDFYLNQNINNVFSNTNTSFIFLTIIYLILSAVFIFLQELKLLNVVYLTAVYIVLSLISIYF
jgi:hypothetical protein